YLDRFPSSQLIRDIINVAYTTEYGLEPDEQSCLNLLWYIGPESGEFSLYGTSDERYHIEVVNDQVPQKLAELLSSSISTGTVLEALREQSDGRYQVTLRSDGRVTDRTYERVILALPFTALRDVAMIMELPEAKRMAIATLSNATNTKLITAYGDRPWAKRYNSTAAILSDTGFQNSWETSQATYASTPASLITNYTGGQAGLAVENSSARASAQAFVSQFDQIFPGVADTHYEGQAIRSSWIGDPFSKGSYSCYKVGQWTRLYNAPAERLGNLFFIGEHCSWEYAGYMEGACETGELAALEILEELGIAESARRQRDRLSTYQMARMRQPHRKPFRQALLNQQRLRATAQDLLSKA
ncbi:MAG: FAD-dependent oxidoreductase, partial [Elainellaceae cyanobacterium]